MRPPFHSPISRIGVRPEPAAIVGPRKRGSRRPHTDATVAAVRRLIEQTELTYTEIAARTGVAQASICRWTRDGGWKRPLFAPRATDTVPRERASARLKARTLAARLRAVAERAIRELEDSASVDPDKLAEALELLKMAKLAARPRRRRRPIDAGSRHAVEDSAVSIVRDLRAAGVTTGRAPEEALEDYMASRAPPPRRRSKREREHAWMLERDPDR